MRPERLTDVFHASPTVLTSFLASGVDFYISDEDAHRYSNMDCEFGSSEKYTTLLTIKSFFDAGLLTPGQLSEEQFYPWDIPHAEWINQVYEKYELYGWEPYGRAFHLALTQEGRNLAAQYLKS